jgi:hypothetical protein
MSSPDSSVISLLKKIEKLENLLPENIKSIDRDVPNKYLLKLSDVRSIEKGKVKSIKVVVPYDYTSCETFTKPFLQQNYMDDTWDSEYRYVHFQGYEDGERGVAVTGSGSDYYIKVTPQLTPFLKKHIKYLEQQINKNSKTKTKIVSSSSAGLGDPKKIRLGTKRNGYIVQKCWVKQ